MLDKLSKKRTVCLVPFCRRPKCYR